MPLRSLQAVIMMLEELRNQEDVKMNPDGYKFKDQRDIMQAFKQRHPKLPMFFRKAAETGAFRTGNGAGSTVKTPDGREMAAEHIQRRMLELSRAGFDETIKEYRQKQEKVQRTRKFLFLYFLYKNLILAFLKELENLFVKGICIFYPI